MPLIESVDVSAKEPTNNLRIQTSLKTAFTNTDFTLRIHQQMKLVHERPRQRPIKHLNYTEYTP